MIGGLVMITAMLASILPARKALKLKPSEAVRQDV
jgi:ABC-type lipoprotein release transport system permease subunit